MSEKPDECQSAGCDGSPQVKVTFTQPTESVWYCPLHGRIHKQDAKVEDVSYV